MPQFPHFRTCAPEMPVLMRDAFDRDRRSLAAADAERRNAALEVLRLQRMQQRHDQPRAGCPNGVAERAGATIDVELVARNPEILLRSHRDHGEGLVDLEEIDIADLPADLVEQLAN